VVNNPQSKDDALEALDFIVNVLKEHEKDLDKLINELATVTEQLGETGQLSAKVDKIEEKMNTIQKEVTNLITYLSTSGAKESVATATPKETPQLAAPIQPTSLPTSGPLVTVNCKQWSDFLGLATQAQTLSFNIKEDDKTLQANALKGNRIITYNGPVPLASEILKAWLSKQLSVSESSVFEGVLAIS
jgi:hypothetical protein